MPDSAAAPAAIVDYGMGNLFSVQYACEYAGLRAIITHSKKEVLTARAVILPGVGAFGTAMDTLIRLDLVEPLRDAAASGIPFLGICLGMQLLMRESHEFGRHRGLGLVEGEVVRLEGATGGRRPVKVPQVGWNKIHSADPGSRSGLAANGSPWEGTLLEGVADGEFMYFVHSFYCKPADAGVTLSTTRYGENLFCSSFRQKNLFACQFHPERSGPGGVRLYRNLASFVKRLPSEEKGADQESIGSEVRII